MEPAAAIALPTRPNVARTRTTGSFAEVINGRAGLRANASLYDASVTGGVGLFSPDKSDLFGVGVNWASPSDSSLDGQVTTELFYRFEFSENFWLTPSVQVLFDPALNPAEDVIGVFGVRARVTF